MDIDQLSRSLKDLEYRVKQLEKAEAKRNTPTPYMPMADVEIDERRGVITRWPWETHGTSSQPYEAPDGVTVVSYNAQFCDCGKDKLLCRAPDCPSHKPDPMGR